MVNLKDYQIGALWMEGRLSFLEQLCLKSFVDAGHHVILYHYGPLLGVPDGIELRDANMVLPRTNFLKHERTGSPALHSDLFRYKMLEQNDGMIWADTDAYCVKKFETPNGHFLDGNLTSTSMVGFWDCQRTATRCANCWTIPKMNSPFRHGTVPNTNAN